MGITDILGKKPAKTPDPYTTAAAQTQTNQQTANYNADLNRVDQVTPYGSSIYTQNGSDPSGAPHYTQTTTLSPLAQQELDNEQKQDASLSGLGFGLADQAKSTLGSGIDTSKLPALSGGPTGYGNVQSSLDYSKLPQLYGGNDFQQSAKDTANALYNQATSRLDPQWNNTQNQQDAKLANQGVLFGTGAYGKAQTQLDQAKNDAYNQANWSSIAAGNDEQQRLFSDSLAQRQQGASEASAQGTFANQSQAQAYGQALQNGQFGNQARAQGLQESTALRDLPLNELNALRSSTQIANPQFSAVPQSQSANTDVTSDIYKSAQMQNDNFNNMMNGLYSVASSAAMASDRRLKRNIRRVGETPILRLPLYAYNYIWDALTTRVGVMADEVLAVAPHAVERTPSGYMAVRYGLLS